jgi:hypothetical protein
MIHRMIHAAKGGNTKVFLNEDKYLMTSASGALTVLPVFTSVTDVPQGVTDQNRIGDEIRSLSLHLKVEFVKNVASTAVVDYCRLMVVQTRSQFTLAPPNATTLFLNDPIVGTVNYRSEWIVDGNMAFKVLYDKLHILPGISTATGAAYRKEFFVSLKRTIKKIQFINASTTDALNKIFFGVMSNTSSTNIPNCSVTAKFRFSDA